jgi:hypothetical protein
VIKLGSLIANYVHSAPETAEERPHIVLLPTIYGNSGHLFTAREEYSLNLQKDLETIC